MEKPPYLTLVDDKTSSDHDSEFIPLPYYPWAERPDSVPLDSDECATAIHLARGDLLAAAELLKAPLVRLHRLVRGSPRLQRVLAECHSLIAHRAAHEYIAALDSPDYRVRWAAAQKVMGSRVAADHAFSPAPASSALTATTASGAGSREIVFRWQAPLDSPFSLGEGNTDGEGSAQFEDPSAG